MDIKNKKPKTPEKNAVIIAFFACLLPQIIRAVLNIVYSYEIEGNIAYSAELDTAFTAVISILGNISFFASFGILITLSANYSLKKGTQWVLLLFGIFFISYVLILKAESYVFGAILYFICAVLSVFALMVWVKGCYKAYITVVASLFMSVIGGLLSVIASEAPSFELLTTYLSYGVSNFCFELLLIICGCILCHLLSKGKKENDISGKLISIKNPVLLTLMISVLAYVIIISITPTINIIDSVNEYGPPVTKGEWMSIIYIYSELFVTLILGYAVMRVTAGITNAKLKR